MHVNLYTITCIAFASEISNIKYKTVDAMSIIINTVK